MLFFCFVVPKALSYENDIINIHINANIIDSGCYVNSPENINVNLGKITFLDIQKNRSIRVPDHKLTITCHSPKNIRVRLGTPANGIATTFNSTAILKNKIGSNYATGIGVESQIKNNDGRIIFFGGRSEELVLPVSKEYTGHYINDIHISSRVVVIDGVEASPGEISISVPFEIIYD